MANRALTGPWRRRALDRPHAHELRHGITDLFGRIEGAPRDLMDLFLLILDQRTSPSERKRMGRPAIVDTAFNAAIVHWALDEAQRPRITLKLWFEMQRHLLAATNEVHMDREQMMRFAGASSSHVSCALSELAAIGAVERIKRGREVRWRVTTLAATHLTGAAREKAQRSEPRPLLNLNTPEA